MWLVHSSIGRKVVMSISGLFLITFLCVHLTANMFMYVSPEAFGLACEFMGSPVVKAIVPILALGFVFHIVYAFVLNARNLRARGHAKYEGGNNTPVSFAAKNMLVLGIIVLAGLAFHLTQFWAQMQLQQFLGDKGKEYSLVIEKGKPVYELEPTENIELIDNNGNVIADNPIQEKVLVAPYYLAEIYFSNIINDIIYIIWIAALWFHLSHGFWSAFQTLGINNRKWFYRWNVIGQIFATIVCLGFISFPISFLLGILG